MKFNKANKNLLSESADMASSSSMMRNTNLLNRDPESMRIKVLRQLGGEDAVRDWKTAENRGITFEAFLVGLVDEVKNGKIDTSIYDEDDDYAGGYRSNRFKE